MANFTVSLGRMVDEWGYDLGLDTYPIWDESYRPALNNKIIEHFYYREIGQETPEIFIRLLNREMNEIMPYFIEMHASIVTPSNMLQNMSVQSDGGTTGTTSSDAKGQSRSYDMPQTRLISTHDYMQAVSESDSTSEGMNEGTSHTQTRGLQGTEAGAAMEYRQAIMNLDMMILNSLEELFMGVYDFIDDVWL